MTSFYNCKKYKACRFVLNIPFKDQKLAIILLGGDGAHCFAGKKSCDYEKGKPSSFFKKFVHRSQPSTLKPKPKK